MNRRRFFGLLAAAPLAFAAMCRSTMPWTSYKFRYVCTPSPPPRRYTDLEEYAAIMGRNAAKQIDVICVEAKLGNYHEYFSYTPDPELAAALANYKENA